MVAYPDILMLGDGAFMSGPYTGATYTRRFRIGGVKLTLDGSPQGKTAWLTQPYLVPPAGQTPDYAGYPAFDGRPGGRTSSSWRSRRAGRCWSTRTATRRIDQFIDAVRERRRSMPGTDRRPVADPRPDAARRTRSIA